MLKGDIRKQAILDTAENLFFEKGYVKATIQDFLDALECSKGSFYHHFESKLQVLTELSVYLQIPVSENLTLHAEKLMQVLAQVPALLQQVQV